VVTLLPTARDQSAWLFSRRNGKTNKYVFLDLFNHSSNSVSRPKIKPENEFRIQHEYKSDHLFVSRIIFIIFRIGVLGQPIEALTMIVSGDAPAVNTSASQLPHIDLK
jgi:hypothetical protein